MNKISYKLNRLWLILRYAFLWKKPAYLFKATKNVLAHKFKIKKTFTLRGLCLAITYTCNFDCPYCFTKEMMIKKKGKEYLQIDDYKKIAKEAIAMGAISFSFQGGEIWLRKDFKEIIKAFHPEKHCITVTTNGSFINEKTVKELKSLRVDQILFSLESGIAKDHDSIVNRPGSYETIMNAIKTTLDNKIRVGINLTLSKKNIYSEGVKKLIEFSNERGLFLSIIFVRALGGWKERRDLMLSDKEISYYNKELAPLAHHASRDLNYNYNRTWGCPAVKESFYINPWGDVLACPFNHTYFGNLKKKSLKEIQQRGLRIKWFDHFHSKCLTAEERPFMDAYFKKIKKSENGYIDYSYWLKKENKNE